MPTLHDYLNYIRNHLLMQPSAQILVGLDFSLLDHLLIKRAAQIAIHLNVRKIVFLHVSAQEIIPDNMNADFKVIHEGKAADLEAFMIEEVEDHLPPLQHVELEYLVRTGKALPAFLQLCQERNFDMILLGKKSDLKGESILTYEVARYCYCPVLFVPESNRLRLQNIMVCNDFSHFSLNAMSYGLSLAHTKPDEVSIYSVHVYRDVVGTDQDDEELLTLNGMNRQKLVHMYNNFIHQLDIGDVHITPIFAKDKFNSIARTLLDEARKHQIDLIIIGARHRSVRTPSYINSLTEKLLHHDIKAPLLLMKKRVDAASATLADVNNDAHI